MFSIRLTYFKLLYKDKYEKYQTRNKRVEKHTIRFFNLIVEIEVQSPASSDELHEQIKTLEQYEKAILSIDTKLNDLYIKLGCKKLTDELFEASKVGGKDLLFETAKKQMQTMNFLIRNSPNEDK